MDTLATSAQSQTSRQTERPVHFLLMHSLHVAQTVRPFLPAARWHVRVSCFCFEEISPCVNRSVRRWLLLHSHFCWGLLRSVAAAPRHQRARAVRAGWLAQVAKRVLLAKVAEAKAAALHARME